MSHYSFLCVTDECTVIVIKSDLEGSVVSILLCHCSVPCELTSRSPLMTRLRTVASVEMLVSYLWF